MKLSGLGWLACWRAKDASFYRPSIAAAADAIHVEKLNVNTGLITSRGNVKKIKIKRYEYQDVAGSRRVVKGKSENNHYYTSDIWTDYAKRLEGLIPSNMVVYGELVGWVDEQTPIQKSFTYNLKPGTNELYVYRVAFVNEDGVIADLSWEGVKDFCASVGIRHVPEVWRGTEVVYEKDDEDFIRDISDDYLDQVLSKSYPDQGLVPLSDPKSVDEGICVRLEGMIPRVFKAKSPLFLTHESKQLDTGEVDLESAA